MPLSLQDALNAYGFVGTLANSIPDLRGILDQAIREEWQPAAFTRALQDSNWWKQNAESVRQLAQLQALDPATYQQNLLNASQKITLVANQMGRRVDPNAVGLQALLNNWDDEQIKSYIGATGSLGVGSNDALFADAAQLDTHLREVAAAYGVAVTEDNFRGMLTQIQAGRDTVDGWEAVMRARAKAQFPHLASQIDAGMSVRDIADPYIATYAQTLEVPETGIKLTDPAIQKALSIRNQDGTAATKPMWQFQRELKDDPRWDKTTNARTEAYTMVNQLGKDFGFLS